MDLIEQEKFIGKEELSVVEAMKKIDDTAKGIIFVVDSSRHLVGSLTDGDVRRFILKTGSLEGTVSQMMNKCVRYIKTGEEYKAYELMRTESIRIVPIVDDNHCIKDFLIDGIQTARSVDSNVLKGVPIIVMAGGKGTRLYPYTKILPKPLIPIGDIPILQRILEKLNQYGADQFYITINYKKEIIKAFFNELNPSYKIEFVEENEPMGTAGSIKLIKKKFNKPLIVTNCDILIDADYGELMKYHGKMKNDITIVSSLKVTTIPYGVIYAEENGVISSMSEKPQLSHFINTGMYVVNPEYFDRIPEDRIFHMTDLADCLLKEGRKVGMYPISENSYLDMGQFEEMKKMEERISNGHEGIG